MIDTGMYAATDIAADAAIGGTELRGAWMDLRWHFTGDQPGIRAAAVPAARCDLMSVRAANQDRGRCWR